MVMIKSEFLEVWKREREELDSFFLLQTKLSFSVYSFIPINGGIRSSCAAAAAANGWKRRRRPFPSLDRFEIASWYCVSALFFIVLRWLLLLYMRIESLSDFLSFLRSSIFFYFKLSLFLPLMISNSSLLSLVLGTRVRLFVHFCRWLPVSVLFLNRRFRLSVSPASPWSSSLWSSSRQQPWSAAVLLFPLLSSWVASSHSNTSKAKYWHWLSWADWADNNGSERACLPNRKLAPS